MQNILDLAHQKEDAEEGATEDDVQIVAPKKSLESAVDKFGETLEKKEEKKNEEPEAVIEGDKGAVELLVKEAEGTESESTEGAETEETAEQSDISTEENEDNSAADIASEETPSQETQDSDDKGQEQESESTETETETSTPIPPTPEAPQAKSKEAESKEQSRAMDKRISKKKKIQENVSETKVTKKASTDEVTNLPSEESPFVSPDDISQADKQMISQILLKDPKSENEEDATEDILENQKSNQEIEMRMNLLNESELSSMKIPQIKGSFDLMREEDLKDVDKDKEKVEEKSVMKFEHSADKIGLGILEILDDLQMGNESKSNLDRLEKKKHSIIKKIESLKKTKIAEVKASVAEKIKKIVQKKDDIISKSLKHRFRNNVVKRRLWKAVTKVSKRMLKSIHRWMVSLDTEQRKREKIETQMVAKLRENLKTVYKSLVSKPELKNFIQEMELKMKDCGKANNFDFCSGRFPEIEEALAESKALIEMTREWNLGVEVDKQIEIHSIESETESENATDTKPGKTMTIPVLGGNITGNDQMNRAWTLGTPVNPIWWRSFQQNKMNTKRNFLNHHQNYGQAYETANRSYDWLNRRPWNYQMNGWGRKMYSPYSHSLGWMRHNTLGNLTVVRPNHNNYFVNGHLVLPRRAHINKPGVVLDNYKAPGQVRHVGVEGFPQGNGNGEYGMYRLPCGWGSGPANAQSKC